MTLPVVYLTRRECISTSHRLHNDILSDEQNREIFGKCNNPAGHGHNYSVELTVRGTVDPMTGMVANIQTLKNALAEVLEPLDHHNLDVDVPYFKNIVSTTENLCVYIWNNLATRLHNPSSSFVLHKVKIFETEKNWAEYRGETC